MASPAKLSRSVERWRRRYLAGEDCSLDTVQTKTKSKSRRELFSPGKMDSSLDDAISSLLINSSCFSKHTFSGRKNSRKHFSNASKNFINVGWLGEESGSHYDSGQSNIQPEFIRDSLESNEVQRTGIYTETDVTLPSGLTVATCSECGGSGVVRETGTQALNGQSLIPSHLSQIYHELSVIYQKLQQESLTQQEYSLKLEQRECFLAEREALLCKHEAALTKIRGVEEKVHAKLQIIKEQHEAAIQQLSEALKEKTKENKRLRSSFDTLKELNDTLKKQLSDVSEQNRKIEAQSRKVQARLENLQRKHEFLIIQKSKEASRAAQEHKPIRPEKVTAVSKTCKVPLNLRIYDLLTVLMDWISDQHLSKLMHEDEKENICKPAGTLSSSRSYTQGKCIKILPLVAEQLQWMPFVNPNLHMHVVKFIYWAIRQLDGGTQYTTMISTMRRLGEDLFKGISPKGSQYVSSEHAADLKLKTATFFKSGSVPLRVVSTLIIIKTVTQADYLAQAFDTLCMDLKTDEGKALFLDYQAVPIILSHIKISSKGLLSSAIDSLLQMTTESRFLHQFLEACSNESFFRTCSVLLRNSKLDIPVLEKLSILLQKLSKIKSNKKMFELFTIHLMIQELQRTAHPEHAFLCINLNSILFNLGLTKGGSPLANSLNTHQ